MIVKNDKEIAGLMEIGQICGTVLLEMIAKAEPGMTTAQLDSIAGQLFAKYGAESAPYGVYKFPGYTCISVNEEVAHGIPGKRILQPGDLVNIDVSASKNGFFGDTAMSIVLDPADKVAERLIAAAIEARANSIKQAVAGNYLNQIGKATEMTAKKHGFKTIRNLCGHGVGRGLHEEPDCINTYYEPRDKRKMTKGIVLAIEPFISERETMVIEDGKDEWCLRTPKSTRVAQCEHTVIVTDEEPIITTLVK